MHYMSYMDYTFTFECSLQNMLRHVCKICGRYVWFPKHGSTSAPWCREHPRANGPGAQMQKRTKRKLQKTRVSCFHIAYRINPHVTSLMYSMNQQNTCFVICVSFCIVVWVRHRENRQGKGLAASKDICQILGNPSPVAFPINIPENLRKAKRKTWYKLSKAFVLPYFGQVVDQILGQIFFYFRKSH